MGNIDSQVLNVQIVIGDSGIGRAAFGIPLIAARGLGVGFTERLRRYNSATDANNDADLSAAAKAAVGIGFAQTRRVNQIAVGRVEDDVAQLVTFTITAASVNDDAFTITINGISVTYTEAGGGVAATAVASALGGLLAAALVAEPVVVGFVGADITVTADLAGQAFTYSSAFVPGAGSSSGITEVLTTANVSIATELQAIADDDPDWYGLTLLSREAIDIERAAGWVETARRLFYAQSSDPDNKTTAGTSIADLLQTLNYQKTHIDFHFDDTEWKDIAELSAFLSVNPDTASTTSANKTLVGVTPHTSRPGQPNTLTATEQANIEAKNANYYGTLKGSGSTWRGIVSGGVLVSIVLSADWAVARMEEGIADIFLRESNAGRKVPLSDPGIQQISQPMRDVIKQGAEEVSPPHFLDDASGTQSFTIPLLSEVPPADKALNRVTFGFTVQSASEIQRVTINGVIAVPV